MEKIYISLGSNLGNRQQNLLDACNLIEERLGKIEILSNIYETEPWGFESSDQFLNQVVCFNSDKSAQSILETLLLIEKEMGRVRGNERFSSRTIDIDILFVGHQVLKNDNLEVPHPRLHERKFVLIPLKEIAPDFVHPSLKKTVSKLLSECIDELKVTIFKP